jgi:hypothetical protein
MLLIVYRCREIHTKKVLFSVLSIQSKRRAGKDHNIALIALIVALSDNNIYNITSVDNKCITKCNTY